MARGAEKEAEFCSADGTALRGALRSVPSPRLGALLVHGITADREEDGFYRRLAERLAEAGMSSLRFDFRAHGKSEGRYEDLTLSGVINDIDAAYAVLSGALPAGAPKVVVAASFGGGLSACWALDSRRPPGGLVLLNPLLDYGKRMLFDKPFWEGGALTKEGREGLDGVGWLPHGEFRIGKALFNELLCIRPHERLKELSVPLLAIHGSSDSMVPYEIARGCVAGCADSEFVTVEGADHGFAHPGDGDLERPETEIFRKGVIEKVADWVGKRARWSASRLELRAPQAPLAGWPARTGGERPAQGRLREPTESSTSSGMAVPGDIFEIISRASSRCSGWRRSRESASLDST